MKTNFILKNIILALLISTTINLNAEENKPKPKTGWRKTADDIDKGSGGDAYDAEVDKVTTRVIGKKGGKMVKHGKNALGAVDTGLNIMDGAITIGEGIYEGDGAKAVSPIVGQDTTDKISAKSGKEWAKEEGKALTAKENEVRQAIKHKLRRKGATKEEAEAAMKHYDSGNKKKFHKAVKVIKDKGIEDKDKRGLSFNDKAEEEDGIKERLYEGGKSAAKKADNFYGGIVQKQQASNKEFEKLKKEQEHTQQGIQDEVDNAVVKKMMRKGVSYEEARAAVDAKRKGDASKFNKLAKQLATKGKEDPSKNEGLSAEGKTAGFELTDYADDMKDKEKKAWEDRSKKMMRPINKIVDYIEQENLTEQEKRQHENTMYGKLRKAGATKKEARRAARDYADGDPKKAIKLGKKLRKRKKDYTIPIESGTDTGEGKKTLEAKGKTKGSMAADDIFGDDDSVENTTAKSDNNGKGLKDSEYDNDYVDVPDKQKDLSAEMILRKELARQKENAFSAEVNKTKNDMAKASTSGDASVRDSQAKIDQAHVEGEGVKIAAADKSNADYQDNSFGEQMSGEITDGIKSGMETAGTAVGTAIGQAMARKIVGDKRREERREEWTEDGGEGDIASSDVSGGGAVPASGGQQISGGRSTQQASDGIIRQTSGGKPVRTGGKGTRQVSGGKPVPSSILTRCARCNLPYKEYKLINNKIYCAACATKVRTGKSPTTGSHKCEYCAAPGTYSNDGKHYYCSIHVSYMPPKKTSEPKPAVKKEVFMIKCDKCQSQTIVTGSSSLPIPRCSTCGGPQHR